jgi:2-dehydro-3-deoxyphosphogalactonate aldolase
MNLEDKWLKYVKALPLVAILRGVKPEEVVDIGEALIKAGFKIVEVPLNSPKAFESIKRLIAALGERALVGAGTVLTPTEVDELGSIGGEICISPNVNVSVIKRAKSLGLISLPGFFTPTEAFAAIDAGADALKLFPGEVAGTSGLKAVKAVLPKDMPVFHVGGVTPKNMKDFIAAGAFGFGIGSSIYQKNDSTEVVFEKAKSFVDAWLKIKK